MIPRYNRPAIQSIWSDENKFKIWTEIECLIAEKLSELGAESFPEFFNLIQRNTTFAKQNNDLATYAKKVNKDEAMADWNMTAEQIVAKVKGLNPFPGVWFVHKRVRIKIISASVTSSRGNPGATPFAKPSCTTSNSSCIFLRLFSMH